MKYTLAILLFFASHYAGSQTHYAANANIGFIRPFDASLTLSDSILPHNLLTPQADLLVRPFSPSFKKRSIIIPAALITYGIVALNNNAVRNLDVTTSKTINDGNKGFKSSIDNYTQYAPVLAVYSLNALGIKGKNNFVDRSIMFGLTTVLTAGIVCSLKPISGVSRPDGSAANSFPSGHTTTAFAAAEFLHQEYKHRSPIFSFLGYAAATTTGVLRMYNNRHYLSDVVAGAGFGILSTKLVYWAYPIVKNKIGGRKSLLAQHTLVMP